MGWHGALFVTENQGPLADVSSSKVADYHPRQKENFKGF